ncbi:MAG: hypothetical protein AB1305_02860 [Candidatus Hadarchaeota archaeon]
MLTLFIVASKLTGLLGPNTPSHLLSPLTKIKPSDKKISATIDVFSKAESETMSSAVWFKCGAFKSVNVTVTLGTHCWALLDKINLATSDACTLSEFSMFEFSIVDSYPDEEASGVVMAKISVHVSMVVASFTVLTIPKTPSILSLFRVSLSAQRYKQEGTKDSMGQIQAGMSEQRARGQHEFNENQIFHQVCVHCNRRSTEL